MQFERPGRGAIEDQIVLEVPVVCKNMVDSIEALCAAVAARAVSVQHTVGFNLPPIPAGARAFGQAVLLDLSLSEIWLSNTFVLE